MCIYILLERRKVPKKRQFGVVMDLWPVMQREFPIIYNNEEMEYLRGSRCRYWIRSLKNLYRKQFKAICEAVPEFADLKIQVGEFFEVMTLVTSRFFDFKAADGSK